jgi:hypothetical protein
MDLPEQDNSKNSSVKALTMMQMNLFMWLHFFMPVVVVAVILNMIYTILCVVCLTTTCFKNTCFRMAAHPLNNDQRFLFLLVFKNVGYYVQTLLLQKLTTIITQKTKKRKSTEAGTDNLNF